jgi:hypothetical protein
MTYAQVSKGCAAEQLKKREPQHRLPETHLLIIVELVALFCLAESCL